VAAIAQLVRPELRAPVLWGLVVGVAQAATPLAFWWLDTATVYALGLVVMGAQDVQGVEVVFTYDPTLVEVVDVGAGSLLTLDGSAVSTERELSAGRARARFSRAAGATGSGAIATVTFRGLRPGSGALALESLVVTRGSGTERPIVANPGRIVVNP